MKQNLQQLRLICMYTYICMYVYHRIYCKGKHWAKEMKRVVWRRAFLGHKISNVFGAGDVWRSWLEIMCEGCTKNQNIKNQRLKQTQTLNMNAVRAAKWRKASSLAQGCAVRCEIIASDGGGVENASAQARHQRARPSTGVNVQRGVSKGYENTSMNTGLASEPHCQLLLAPRRRNKPTLGKNTARARAPALGDTSEVSGKTSMSTLNFYELMEKQD